MDLSKPIALLFDLDGVILDTESQYSIFWKEMGRIFKPSIEGFETIIKGQTLTQIMEQHFNAEPEVEQELIVRLTKFEQQMSYDYVNGAEQLLVELKQKEISTAVVTSSGAAKMERVYKVRPELTTYFDQILTAERFSRSKPAPDCYLLAAELFDTIPQNCVVFEDSFHGLTAGRKAGMKVVGLSTTNSQSAISAYCDLVIPDFLHFSSEDISSLLG